MDVLLYCTLDDLASRRLSSKPGKNSENGREKKEGVFRLRKDRIKASFPEANRHDDVPTVHLDAVEVV